MVQLEAELAKAFEAWLRMNDDQSHQEKARTQSHVARVRLMACGVHAHEERHPERAAAGAASPRPLIGGYPCII